ncbi:ABC transporter G family member 7-like [Trichoplusia ni]|uniref:ABC transporter G family member 7-like n=1 Tax=Trichoplusia ni TaxID=7111 RepID=A0A7E5WHG0_TRINI|nr:ABC transporter G family member 7-like [Trichoplusia ni]
MIGTNNIIDSKKIRESLDLDALDYSEIEYSKHTDNRINNEEVVNNNSDATISDIDNYLIDKQTINNDIVVISDDSTSPDENTDQNKYKNNSKNNDIPKPYNINSKFNENTSKMYNIIPKFNENTPKPYESSKKIAILNESYTKNGNSLRDDNTNDSGFENDSTFALSAVKLFFSELCSTFRITHKLIGQCRLLISKEDLCEMKKKQLRYQASKSLEYLTPIMQHLESIIKRESAEETVLKSLLLKAGLEASMDKRMTHYRQIAIKFLEQAHILEFGLKSIVSITNGNFTALPATEVTTSNYFNIFE